MIKYALNRFKVNHIWDMQKKKPKQQQQQQQQQQQDRVATTQGKQGIWFLLFPDRENTGNFAVTQGKYF